MGREFSLLYEANQIVARVTAENPLKPLAFGLTPDIVGREQEIVSGITPISKTSQLREAVFEFAADKLLTPRAAAITAIGVPAILVGSGVVTQDGLRILSGVVLGSVMHGVYKIGMDFLEFLDEQSHH